MIFALHGTKVKMSTTFVRDRRWNFAHEFNVPLPSLLRMFCFVLFFAGRVGSLKTQISQKIKNTNIWQKRNKTKKNIRKRLGRDTLKTCANFQDILLSKTAWTLDSEGIGGIMLEPACTRYPWRFWAWQRVYLSMIRFSTWRPRMAASVIKVDIYPVLV